MLTKTTRTLQTTLAWLLCSILLVVPLVFTPGKAWAAPTVLYASPTGSGTTCSLAAPCSLTGARDQARLLLSGMTTMSGNLIVYLRGGSYNLTSTYSLGLQDSGKDGYSVVYRNYPDETPMISGGYEIPSTSWTVHDLTANIYKANVGSRQFRQLYAAGSRAVRARNPNMTDPNTGGPYYTALNYTSSFRVNASEIGSWANSGKVEFVWNAHWRHKRMMIDSYSVTGAEAELTFVEPGADLLKGLIDHTPQDPTYYYFENALELLDAEGEWYLDMSTPSNHMLYYKPRSGESMPGVQVMVPQLETLVTIGGTNAANPAHHIELRGITFAYSNWTKPNAQGGYLETQAGLPTVSTEVQNVAGAIKLAHANHIRFEQNTVKATGGHGLLMKGTLAYNAIVGNHFTDLSAGGIYSYSSDSSNDFISGNLVDNVGRYYTDGVGILATKPDHMTIEFNEVHTAPYSGISIGWQWNDAETGTDNNVVQYNKVHDVMQLLDDGGGIYTAGAMHDSSFHHNYVYAIAPSAYLSALFPYPVVGIYLDGGSAFKTVHHNVLDATGKAFFANNPPNHDNTFDQNYRNVVMGNIGTNTVTNDQNYTGTSWPASANDIISGAGVIKNELLALTSPVVAASSSTGSYTPIKAVNDSTDEPGWKPSAGSSGNPWWQIDLGASYRIKKIEIVSRLGTTDEMETRRNFKIMASNSPAMTPTNSVEIGRKDSDASSFPHQSTWSAIITELNAYRYIAIIKTVAENFYLNEVRIYR